MVARQAANAKKAHSHPAGEKPEDRRRKMPQMAQKLLLGLLVLTLMALFCTGAETRLASLSICNHSSTSLINAKAVGAIQRL
jgi:hypothetical protein